MLDSIYHMPLRLLLNLISDLKTIGLSILLHGVISLTEAMSYDSLLNYL